MGKPLDGVRVLALENYYAGNIGSMALVRFGAEVIKVEMPGMGDIMRHTGPSVQKGDRTRNLSELRVMGGKKSIAIDLASDEGLDVVWRLVEICDVVWTNMKPSSLKRMGITYEALQLRNPAIIYTSLSGFGHDDLAPEGPLAHLTAFDIIAQGLAGLQFRVEGEAGRPGYNGLALGDQVSAMNAVLGTVLALYRRLREPGAQRVDVAMHDSMLFVNELSLGLTAFTGEPPPRGRSGTSAPYGAYKTSDGYVNIAVGSSPIWRRLCLAMERPDLAADPRFKEGPGRVAHFAELDSEVEAWTLQKKTNAIVDLLSAQTIPCAPIFDMPDVLSSPQVSARRMLVEVRDPIAGRRRIVGNPIKMSDLDDSFAPTPPACGENATEILTDLLGFSSDDVLFLRSSGAVV